MLWANMQGSDTSRPDAAAVHSAQPVRRGEKWAVVSQPAFEPAPPLPLPSLNPSFHGPDERRRARRNPFVRRTCGSTRGPFTCTRLWARGARAKRKRSPESVFLCAVDELWALESVVTNVDFQPRTPCRETVGR